MLESPKDRKPEHILADIEQKLATIDGIAMSDAFVLGRLIQEYGAACGGQVMLAIVGSMMEKTVGPKPPEKEPWRPDPRE